MPMDSLNVSKNKVFLDYIKDKKVLVADADSASRSSMAATLKQLGTDPTSIIMAPSFNKASELIKQHKPQLVLCEFKLGNRSGLDLLSEQRHQLGKEVKNSIFVLVTGDSSQSAVAQAAEEDVDAFVLKPFTLEIFRNTIIETASRKAFPSSYQQKIDEGKDHFDLGQKDEALTHFEEAVQLSDKPTLAHFYSGFTHTSKQSLDDGKSEFGNGLEHNKIHFKCLTGLYDVLMEQKEHKEAYDVVKKISRYFPANPKRLASVLRLAIMTENYEDIERYYKNFVDLDLRTGELVRYVCAALVVCGKFYLRDNHHTRAHQLFDKALITAKDNTRIIKEVVNSLVEYGFAKEAQKALQRFPKGSHENPDYLVSELKIMKLTEPQLVLSRCKEILKGDVVDSEIYTIAIEEAKRMGERGVMEEWFYAAIDSFPSMKKHFESLT